LLSFLLLYITVLDSTKTVTCLSFGAINNNHNNSNYLNRIEVTTSPLIGGPSWLPLHCKVVIDDGMLVVDYVPKNPTSTNTIQKLITFQNVPAQVRIQRRRRKRRGRRQPSSVVSSNGVSATGNEHDNDNDEDDNIILTFPPGSDVVGSIVLSETTISMTDVDIKDDHDPFLHRAIQFCTTYDKDLHLISNNCWTFAFDFIRHIVFVVDP
jgi:hypothetical protein